MAWLEPSEEDIRNFLEMAPGLDRHEVIQRLKGNNNNVAQAIGEYYDDPKSGEKYRWDDGVFNSGRDGAQDTPNIAFNIQGPDEPGVYSTNFNHPAPSRPPSRNTNNKSPLSKIIDLTGEHAAADPSNSLGADPELERALAMSLEDQKLPAQESGVTMNGVHFGPATQNQYEEKNWGMVPVGRTSAQEIMLDPDPAYRRREPDTPAFLKPSIASHRLGALITIYHEIPMARNIFLNSIDVLQDYGDGSEWWAGTAIEIPRLVADDEPTYPEVDRELQRLMAFLDGTDRSYGSIEPLVSLPDVQQAMRLESTAEPAVMRAWSNIFEENNSRMVQQIFSEGVGSDQEDMLSQPTKFAILELDLPEKGSGLQTLYDIADEVLWPNLSPDNVDNSPYLSHVGEIIVFRVKDSPVGEHQNVEVPAVWYPDRYLKPGREAALQMRLQKKNVIEDIGRISNEEARLTTFTTKGGKTVKVRDLIEASLKHDEAQIEGGLASDQSIVQPSVAAAKLSTELQKVMESIDKKLVSLDSEKAKALDELRKLSQLYTQQSSDPATPKLRKYALRGVTTTQNTMYICRRIEPDLISFDMDVDESSTDDQWWRISYAPHGAEQVIVEKTTEEKVLEATKTESKNIILVYASDKAMNMPLQALPKSLETFVSKDNAHFKKEFQESSSPNPKSPPPPLVPSSPGKRKRVEDSGDESSITVRERELGGSEETTNSEGSNLQGASRSLAAITMSGQQRGEMLMGIDLKQEPEMQERNGLSRLASRPRDDRAGTIDSMDLDLDQVIEDQMVAGPSAAVKRVGFAE